MNFKTPWIPPGEEYSYVPEAQGLIYSINHNASNHRFSKKISEGKC